MMLPANDKIIKFAFVTELSKNLKNTIHLADAKANIVLFIQTFLISTVLGATILSDTFKGIDSQGQFLKFGFLFFLICFLSVSIIGLILAVYVFMPRKSSIKHNKEVPAVTFYEEIKSFSTSLEYFNTVNALTDEQVIEELAVENYNLSIIISKKMRYTRKSIIALFTSIILSIIIVFFVIAIKQ